MLASRRSEINRIADSIRTSLELDVPVDVDQGVERLRGKVVMMGPGEPDAYVRKDGQAFVIAVKDQADTRRRFSIAHELGHLFLHMGYIVEPSKWNAINEYVDSPRFRFGHSEEEYEAHEFAGAFLMPRNRFHALVRKHTQGNKVAMQPIAEAFGVSLDAARTRGQWLGFLEWSRHGE